MRKLEQVVRCSLSLHATLSAKHGKKKRCQSGHTPVSLRLPIDLAVKPEVVIESIPKHLENSVPKDWGNKALSAFYRTVRTN